ncbi:hypothetical protein [Kineococcus sp. SYSU DK018]|uniref:hypothetical protein n=1 Tax=Kineococcus sp. SYSU DK018 TaxID=3383139 RepID=UPI003D7EA31C
MRDPHARLAPPAPPEAASGACGAAAGDGAADRSAAPATRTAAPTTAAPTTPAPAATPAVTPAATSAGAEAPAPAATAPVTAPAPRAGEAVVVAPVPLGTTEDLEVAVRLRSDALLTADVVTAQRLLSARCRSAVPDGALREAAGAGFAAVTAVTSRATGGTAEVDYSYSVPGRDVTGERWSAEDGQWRWDAC